MNQTLQYFKNIKLNPFVKRKLTDRCKKKYSVNNSKNSIQNVLIRKYTTSSYNRPPFSPNPNNNFWFLIMLASGVGIFNIIKGYPPPPQNIF